MQLISKKYLSNVLGSKKAKDAGRKDCLYPYKKKKNFNTLWDHQIFKINYNKNIIYLSKAKGLLKTTGETYFQKPIKIFTKNIPPNILIIELKYDNGLKLCLNYYEETINKNINKGYNNICSIDFGEIHSITSIDNNGNSLIITGREIRSIQRFRNKELAKLNNMLSKCIKGSRKYKKLRSAIIKLSSKTNQKINYLLHKISKLFINYINNNKINKVIIGNLNNFNMNLKNKKRKKGQLQRLTQWSYGKLKYKIKYKLKNININLIEISEEFTSQTCPFCGNKHKPKGRNYVCKCGYKNHRDIVGAINILSKYLNNGKIKSINLPQKELKYLRI